jgi:hypothetical protein
MSKIVLWGTPKGAKSWEEEVITETADKDHLKKAREWATANGFINLREMNFNDGDKPDFIGTISKYK